ncbi:nuclear localization sequence binding protein [Gurleya vavrai]
MESKKQQTIIANGLNKKTELQTLLTTFKQYGKITGLKIITRIRSDSETIIGFIIFDEIEDAKRMMTDLEKKITIDGQEVALEFATFGKSRRNDAYVKAGFYRTKLFVTGLPKDSKQEDISEILGKCRLTFPKDGQGYCFADYVDEDAKNEAIMTLNGKNVGGDHPLRFAPAFYGKRDEKKGDVSYKKKNGARREKISD